MNEFDKAVALLLTNVRKSGEVRPEDCDGLEQSCQQNGSDPLSVYSLLYQALPQDKVVLGRIAQILRSQMFSKSDVSDILDDLKKLYQQQCNGNDVLGLIGLPSDHKAVMDFLQDYNFTRGERSHERQSPFSDIYISFRKKRITENQKGKQGDFASKAPFLSQFIFNRITEAYLPSFISLPFGLQWWHGLEEVIGVMSDLQDKDVEMTEAGRDTMDWMIRDGGNSYTMFMQFDDPGYIGHVNIETCPEKGWRFS